MSDGLIGAALNHKFLLTFNTELENLDRAVTRPGRLRYLKKFERLTKEQARKVAKDNNLILPDKEDFSLAEIFNGEGLAKQEQQKARIGF